jgi:hypothetical protein
MSTQPGHVSRITFVHLVSNLRTLPADVPRSTEGRASFDAQRQRIRKRHLTGYTEVRQMQALRCYKEATNQGLRRNSRELVRADQQVLEPQLFR